MAWYKSGTVTVTNNSKVVTGTGTAWVQGASVGEAFFGPDQRIYEIEAINSSTSLTLTYNYAGATAGGQAYSIVPTQGYIRDLAAQAAQLIQDFGTVANQAGAGKFAAGSAIAPSVRGVADENTGVNLPGGDVLQFMTGGTSRLNIGANGVSLFTSDAVAPTLGISGGYGALGLSVGYGDGATGLLSNLRMFSTYGIGFGPSVSGTPVPVGENSHWFDVRTGNTGVRGALYVGGSIRAGQTGPWAGEAYTFQSNGGNNSLTAVFGGTAGGNVSFYSQNGAAASTAACSVWINAAGNTSRSINCGGTVNASGSDYAEYHRKAPQLLDAQATIAKGQIVGFTAHDEITDRWSDACSFGIKSTDPSYVGGDTWGTPAAVGLVEPAYPLFVEPPPQTVFVDEMAPEEARLTAAQAAADAHTHAVAAARAAYEAGPLADYTAAKAQLAAALELERQKVDRIAYSGRVPVNVTGAEPGDYLVAAEGPDDSIIGESVTPAALRGDMTRYLSVVGRVRSILPDGRAYVAVVVH